MSMPDEAARSAALEGAAFAITVEFRLKPSATERFLGLVLANAATSLSEEPLCLRFDVLTARDPARGGTVTLYEVYADRAAFEHHLATPHFRAFEAAVRDLVAEKSVLEFDLHDNAGRVRDRASRRPVAVRGHARPEE
jgi:autoinducer 2-degrading protein